MYVYIYIYEQSCALYLSVWCNDTGSSSRECFNFTTEKQSEYIISILVLEKKQRKKNKCTSSRYLFFYIYKLKCQSLIYIFFCPRVNTCIIVTFQLYSEGVPVEEDSLKGFISSIWWCLWAGWNKVQTLGEFKSKSISQSSCSRQREMPLTLQKNRLGKTSFYGEVPGGGEGRQGGGGGV